MEPKPKIERGIIMENEIMNYVENNGVEVEDIVSEVGKEPILVTILKGAGKLAAGYAIGKGIEKGVKAIKAKMTKKKKDIPEDITEDKIDEIPE